jgi:hypothetical protein
VGQVGRARICEVAFSYPWTVNLALDPETLIPAAGATDKGKLVEGQANKTAT